MSELFQGYTKVAVKTCRITSLSSKKTAEINKIVNSIDIFMSIYDATMKAILTIEDKSGLIYDLPIVGEELVSLEIETPNKPAINKTFYVYAILDIQQEPNNSKTKITMELVSIDHMRGISRLVEHGMKTTLSSMVKNILTDTVKTPAKVNVEDSKGIETIAPAGWNAWQTIDVLRQRAVGVKYHSPYLFFEDNDGYNFVTVEGLIEQKKAKGDPIKITSIPFNPGAGEGSGKSTLTDTQYRNVDDFRIIEKADMASNINNGGVSNKTIVLDIMEKKVKVINRSMKDFTDSIRQPLDDKFNPQHSDLWNDVIPTPPVKYFLPIDSSNVSEHAEHYGMRRMFNKIFNSIRVGFSMYGDSSLNPGDILYIQVPRTINNEVDDIQLTGNYMVSHIRHTIVDDEMMTLVEANRFGLAGKVL